VINSVTAFVTQAIKPCWPCVVCRRHTHGGGPSFHMAPAPHGAILCRRRCTSYADECVGQSSPAAASAAECLCAAVARV